MRTCASIVAAAVISHASLGTAQTPTPLGPVFTIDATTSGYDPKVAVDSDGDFMVAWSGSLQGNDDVLGRLFQGNGSPLGPGFVVQDPGWEYGYGVASDKDGRIDVAASGSDSFVVVFNGEDDLGTCENDPCVLSRRYDDDGTAGTQFMIQQTAGTTWFATNPEVAQNALGEFMVVWEAGESDYADEEVFARALDGDGAPAASRFHVNETTVGYQGDNGWVDVAGGPSGDFVLTWHDDYEGIGVRRFSSSGVPLGPEVFVEDDESCPTEPQVAYEAGGNFLVLSDLRCSSILQAQVFGPTGAPIGPAFTIDNLGSEYPRPAVAGFPNDHFVVVWETASEIRGQRYDRVGGPVGSTFQVSDTLNVFGAFPDVDTEEDGNFTVIWKAANKNVVGQRFTAPDVAIPITSKKLKIKDRVPDHPEKRKLQWVVKDPNITLPVPGSLSDPSCNGDPAGTVKASLRFFSDDSGHDSGVIDLPCQWWASVGSGAKRAYQYKDLKLFDGPCKFVQLKTGKQIRATCLGRNLSHTLDYDLEIGAAEGTVQTVLTIGNHTFCAATPTFRTKDGSDGKLFLGKDGPAPASCT